MTIENDIDGEWNLTLNPNGTTTRLLLLPSQSFKDKQPVRSVVIEKTQDQIIEQKVIKMKQEGKI